MTRFTGIWVPLVTPFHNGEIEFAALKATARKLCDTGITGLVTCATTGESAALSEDEQLAVLDTVIEAVPGQPVVMGLCDNNMSSLLSRLERIQERPIAGLLVTPPYYIRPSQAGLVEYFKVLADAASVPIIIYNIPYRTGVAMDLETLRAIAQHERVVAIKDCGGSLALTMQLIADGDLDVLAGDDQQILSTLCLGGSGAIAASAHIRPDLFAQLPQLVNEARLEEAREIFYRLLPVIHRAFEEPNPGPVKAALAIMGQMRDELRSPMQAASAETREALRKELERLGCI
jgi:4-hydroxy-tetrahydrodipicolinate synthase